jgi:TonB family protein
MWALGVTMVQALTQRMPTWPDGGSQTPLLPEGFPRDFGDVVLRCLHQNPTERPTPQELKGQISGEITAPLAVLPEPMAVAPDPPAPQKTVVSRQPARQEPVLSEPVRAEIVSRAVAEATAPTAARATPKRSITPLLVGAAIGLLVIWGWTRLFHKPRNPPPSVADQVQPAPTAAPQTSPMVSRTLSQPSSAPEVDLPPGVLHQELPTVARSANETIHGHFRVVVRVVVNRSGKVIDESLEEAGPSKYFAKQASTAAREWKFVAADDHGAREWLLRFDFSKDQVSAQAEAAASPRS